MAWKARSEGAAWDTVEDVLDIYRIPLLVQVSVTIAFLAGAILIEERAMLRGIAIGAVATTAASSVAFLVALIRYGWQTIFRNPPQRGSSSRGLA